jgi:hypothetical protein
MSSPYPSQPRRIGKLFLPILSAMSGSSASLNGWSSQTYFRVMYSFKAVSNSFYVISCSQEVRLEPRNVERTVHSHSGNNDGGTFNITDNDQITVHTAHRFEDFRV